MVVVMDTCVDVCVDADADAYADVGGYLLACKGVALTQLLWNDLVLLKISYLILLLVFLDLLLT